jgi:hypothetical protein
MLLSSSWLSYFAQEQELLNIFSELYPNPSQIRIGTRSDAIRREVH